MEKYLRGHFIPQTFPPPARRSEQVDLETVRPRITGWVTNPEDPEGKKVPQHRRLRGGAGVQASRIAWELLRLPRDVLLATNFVNRNKLVATYVNWKLKPYNSSYSAENLKIQADHWHEKILAVPCHYLKRIDFLSSDVVSVLMCTKPDEQGPLRTHWESAGRWVQTVQARHMGRGQVPMRRETTVGIPPTPTTGIGRGGGQLPGRKETTVGAPPAPATSLDRGRGPRLPTQRETAVRVSAGPVESRGRGRGHAPMKRKMTVGTASREVPHRPSPPTPFTTVSKWKEEAADIPVGVQGPQFSPKVKVPSSSRGHDQRRPNLLIVVEQKVPQLEG